MIPALPLVGKILVGLVASGAGSILSPQDADAAKVGDTAKADDFTQAVDDLQRAANATTTTHGSHATGRS